MAKPKSATTILKTLSPSEVEKLRVWFEQNPRENPKVAKLKAQHADLTAKLHSVETEIAALIGEPVKAKPVKPVSKAKPGRKPKAKPDAIEGDAQPKRRGRKPGKAKAEKTAPEADDKRAAMLERMAKMRAAKANKAE